MAGLVDVGRGVACGVFVANRVAVGGAKLPTAVVGGNVLVAEDEAVDDGEGVAVAGSLVGDAVGGSALGEGCGDGVSAGGSITATGTVSRRSFRWKRPSRLSSAALATSGLIAGMLRSSAQRL